MEPVYYSVCAPVYNEQESLPALLEKIQPILAGMGKPWELILTDDGSTDSSLSLMRELKTKNPFLRILQLNGHHGQTAAMAAGIRAARGEVIITIDADLQNDPNDIPKLVEKLADHDAVIGWRTNRQDNWFRRFSSRFANWFRNLVTNDRVHDTGCSLKAFRADFLKKIPLFEGMHRFFPALILLENGKIAEVPVNHQPRTMGTSKYTAWNRVFRSFLDLLAFAWMRWRHLNYKVDHEY